MKTLLITRPDHDDTTHYLSNWSRSIIDIANKKGLNLLDLHGKKANKEELVSYIIKKKPSLIILNGHGSDDTIAGYDDKPLIKSGENDDILNSAIVYARSCSSAKKLGRESIKSGAKSYIGYDDDFIFVYEPNKITKPLADNTAKLFLEPSNEIAISLIKENTTEESCGRSRKHFMDNISRLLTSESSPDAPALVRYLWWDMKNQVCLGDKKSVF